MARLLSFVLLIFIAYGATAGAAHSHSKNLTAGRAGASANVCGSNNPGSTSGETGADGECLMCRLHQHLFAGLVHSIPDFIAPISRPVRSTVFAISCLSQTQAPRRGRAPPSTSTI